MKGVDAFFLWNPLLVVFPIFVTKFLNGRLQTPRRKAGRKAGIHWKRKKRKEIAQQRLLWNGTYHQFQFSCLDSMAALQGDHTLFDPSGFASSGGEPGAVCDMYAFISDEARSLCRKIC
jgi:hypothetical protein